MGRDAHSQLKSPMDDQIIYVENSLLEVSLSLYAINLITYWILSNLFTEDIVACKVQV